MEAAFLIDGCRTPFGRYAGSLSGVRPDDMGAHVIRKLLERNPSVLESEIEDVILGNANQAGEDNRNIARMSALIAGLPIEVAGVTINRLCGSGLDAILYAARSIAVGEGALFIAGGAESMSRAPFVMAKAEAQFSRDMRIYDTTMGWRFVNPIIQRIYGTDSMPDTAENVGAKFGISRQDQDKFAYQSQMRTLDANKQGKFRGEIAPIEILRAKQKVLMDSDEHPRPETTVEQLSKLPAPFRDNGAVTAGNASGINDGAAALLVGSEEYCKSHDIQPYARIVAGAVAGVEPKFMGLGPISATRKLLERTKLQLNDMDVIEINEAFAVQVIACLRELGIDPADPRVNPNGGAISIGHPLGASGARCAMSAMYELDRREGKYALVTMCIGVGQGISMIIERV